MSYSTLPSLADELGRIRADLKSLKDRESAIKNQILALGVDRLDGALFGATVVEQFREQTDWKAIAAKFSPSRQLVTAYTKTARVVSVKTTGLKAQAA